MPARYLPAGAATLSKAPAIIAALIDYARQGQLSARGLAPAAAAKP
jgi:hypothetical protein